MKVWVKNEYFIFSVKIKIPTLKDFPKYLSKSLNLNFRAKSILDWLVSLVNQVVCGFYVLFWHWVKFGLFLLRLKDLGCKKVSSESLKAKRVEFFFRKRWRERKKAVKNCAASAPGKNALWHYWASDGLAQESCDVEALTAERKKNLQPTIEGPPKTGQPISDRLETSKSYQTYLVAPHSSIYRKKT